MRDRLHGLSFAICSLEAALLQELIALARAYGGCKALTWQSDELTT